MRLLFLSAFILATILQSCTEGGLGTSPKYVPPSSGTHAEMLLVVNDSLWRSKTGEKILETFAREQYGLPQFEGIFSVNRVATPAFKGLLKKAKSIVIVEIGDTTMIDIKRDVWAKPQVVTTIIATNKKQLILLLKRNQEQLVKLYHKADLGVVRKRMANVIYKKLPTGLAEIGIADMYLQKGFEQTLDRPGLKIFRQDTKKTTQFFVFSTRPMAEDVLAGQDIIAARDSIGKHFFEGGAEGSYFATETIIPPLQESTKIDGRFAIETRGLWKTMGDFMGGPFLSYTIYNDERQEILTVEGFLFGPDAKKRNILLEMEAMLTSVKLN